MKRLLLTIITVLAIETAAYAIPVLQVGVSDGSGGYISYTPSSTSPTETYTAITNDLSFVVGGLVAPFVSVTDKDGVTTTTTEYLGGKVGTGCDWSDYGLQSLTFDGHGALLLVSVPDGQGDTAFTSLKMNGYSAFAWDSTNDYFPNTHDPVKSNISDFLFFDIGSFLNLGSVPNFADPADTSTGVLKYFTVSGVVGLPWLHFDVMAIQTTEEVTGTSPPTYDNPNKFISNPGSHDVTWKDDGGGGNTGGDPVVPEPGTLLLLGAGLFGLAIYGRRKMDK